MRELLTWRDIYFSSVGVVSTLSLEAAAYHARATEGLSLIAALLLVVSLLALPGCLKHSQE